MAYIGKRPIDTFPANNAVIASIIAGNAVGSSEIAANAVTATQIADNAVTATKIPDSSIVTAHIADNAITAAKIPDNVLTATMLPDNIIAANHLPDNVITATMIPDDLIDSDHYAAGSIDNEHLADDAVDSDELAAGAIDTAHIGASQVTTAKIADNAITAAKLPDNVITATMIPDDLIDSNHYAAGSIDNEHLADDAVGADELATNAVVAASIVAGSITTTEIAANTIAVGNIADNAVDATKIASNSILTRHIDDNQITGDQISDDIVLSGTGAIRMPDGTTGQRPGSPAAGMFRYNTTDSKFEGYTSSWGEIGGGGTNTFTTDTYTNANSTDGGSNLTYTLSQSISDEDNLIIFIDGVFQNQAAYSVSGTTLTLADALQNSRTMVVYSVNAAVSGNNLNIDTMTGDNSDTTLALSVTPVSENNTQVFIDGVYQAKSTYSTSGAVLTFTEAPPTGALVECMTFTQTDINVPTSGSVVTDSIADDAVTSAKLDTNIAIAGTLDVTGALTMGANAEIKSSSGYTVYSSTGSTYIDSVSGNSDILFRPGASQAVIMKGESGKVGIVAT